MAESMKTCSRALAGDRCFGHGIDAAKRCGGGRVMRENPSDDGAAQKKAGPLSIEGPATRRNRAAEAGCLAR